MVGRPTVRGLYSRKGRKWHATCGREREQLSSYELGIKSVCLVEPVLGLYRVPAGSLGLGSLVLADLRDQFQLLRRILLISSAAALRACAAERLRRRRSV